MTFGGKLIGQMQNPSASRAFMGGCRVLCWVLPQLVHNSHQVFVLTSFLVQMF